MTFFLNCLLGSEQQLAEDIWFGKRKKNPAEHVMIAF
jgi:hypothetical protein